MARPEPGAERPPLQIEAVPVLHDNYVMVLTCGDDAVLVDPAVAPPLQNWLEQRGMTLVAVLQTHHHHDHIGGTPELMQRWPRCRVFAAEADRRRIPFLTDPLADGDRFVLLGQPIDVLAVPGHTRAHIAYHLPASGDLFCGDTLFAAGCGRLFEGTAAQMHAALQRLCSLPEHTRVWCAHEYTAGNLRWAISQVQAHEPLGQALRQRLEQVLVLRAQGLPTIPSSVALELQTNLFVRAGSAERLAALRSSKDHWSG